MPDFVAQEGQLGKLPHILKRKVYPVLVEVLLDFEAAHTAVPLCHAAAQKGQRQQQQSSPCVGHPVPAATAKRQTTSEMASVRDREGRSAAPTSPQGIVQLSLMRLQERCPDAPSPLQQIPYRQLRSLQPQESSVLVAVARMSRQGMLYVVLRLSQPPWGTKPALEGEEGGNLMKAAVWAPFTIAPCITSMGSSGLWPLSVVKHL